MADLPTLQQVLNEALSLIERPDLACHSLLLYMSESGLQPTPQPIPNALLVNNLTELFDTLKALEGHRKLFMKTLSDNHHQIVMWSQRNLIQKLELNEQEEFDNFSSALAHRTKLEKEANTQDAALYLKCAPEEPVPGFKFVNGMLRPSPEVLAHFGMKPVIAQMVRKSHVRLTCRWVFQSFNHLDTYLMRMPTNYIVAMKCSSKHAHRRLLKCRFRKTCGRFDPCDALAAEFFHLETGAVFFYEVFPAGEAIVEGTFTSNHVHSAVCENPLCMCHQQLHKNQCIGLSPEIKKFITDLAVQDIPREQLLTAVMSMFRDPTVFSTRQIEDYIRKRLPKKTDEPAAAQEPVNTEPFFWTSQLNPESYY